jgi:hypothetical protein
MGKIEKGILGGFSGKVGTVVGGNWRGIDYMRSKGKRSKADPTVSQLEQQAKFALATRFAQTMSPLLATGFSYYTLKQTALNSAVSYILKNAVSGAYPNSSILYANVLISRGDIPTVLAPTATATAGSKLTYNWTDNSGTGTAKPTDKVMLAAYCPELNQCVYTTGSASRSDLTDELNLASFSGKQVHTYIGGISENGRSIANSIYTGPVTVL